MHSAPLSRGFRPLRGLRALRAIFTNPDDTEQVGEILDAFGSRRHQRWLLARFLEQPDGRSLLEDRRPLGEVLADRAALEALPECSLGRSYLDYMQRESLALESLLELQRADPAYRDEDAALHRALRARLFALHDVLHVVTGFGRDLVGEAALLAFTHAQVRAPALGALVSFLYGMTYVRPPRALVGRVLPKPPPGSDDPGVAIELRRCMRSGRRMGREAAWLPGVDWEARLASPLEAVRRELGIQPIRYAPLRSAEAAAVLASAEPGQTSSPRRGDSIRRSFQPEAAASTVSHQVRPSCS